MRERGEVERLRRAVDLVLHDARIVLGSDALSVVYAGDDLPRELADLALFLDRQRNAARFPEPDAWSYISAETGATGLMSWPSDLWPDFVVRLAENLQETVIESGRFWGRAFPPCPEHPGTPLWPHVVANTAVWSCINGGTTRIPIGSWDSSISP